MHLTYVCRLQISSVGSTALLTLITQVEGFRGLLDIDVDPTKYNRPTLGIRHLLTPSAVSFCDNLTVTTGNRIDKTFAQARQTCFLVLRHYLTFVIVPR